MRSIAALIAGLALFAVPAHSDEVHSLFKKGKSAYKQFCSHCHGIGMVNPGTGSYDLRKYPVDRKADFYVTVKKGKGDMPAWGDILLEEELEWLWVYVATRAGKEPFPQKSTATAPVAENARIELITEKTLTVCLADNGGAMSGRHPTGGTGIDYKMAEELARRLNLKLKVTWFESEAEEESDPVRETYAMLAMGLCDLVPATPLYKNAVGDPPTARAAPPRWDDIPGNWDRATQINLEPVTPTQPYMRAEVGIVITEDVSGDIVSLKDLEGLQLGVQQGTLAAIIVKTQTSAGVQQGTISVTPGYDFLWRMEKGEFNAAVVDVATYDFHLRQNPVSKLKLASYRHPLGFNIGMAGLARNKTLIARADTTIASIREDGTVARLAEAENVHYAAPKKPWLQQPLTIRDFIESH